MFLTRCVLQSSAIGWNFKRKLDLKIIFFVKICVIWNYNFIVVHRRDKTSSILLMHLHVYLCLISYLMVNIVI